MLVGSSIGKIYTHLLDLNEQVDDSDNLMLVEYLDLEGEFAGNSNEAFSKSVESLYYSTMSDILFVAFRD